MYVIQMRTRFKIKEEKIYHVFVLVQLKEVPASPTTGHLPS